MCGNPFKQISNIVSNAVKNPLSTIGDVAAVATGNPLFAVAGNTANGLTKGQSIGKSVGSGLEAGAETFAGQELVGAAGNAFPETFGAINDSLETSFGTAGNSLTDAVGLTSGAGTSFDDAIGSLGNIGGSIGSSINSLGDTISSGFDGLFSSGSAGGTATDVTPLNNEALIADPLSQNAAVAAGVDPNTFADPNTAVSAIVDPNAGTAATALPSAAPGQSFGQSATNFNTALAGLDPNAVGGVSPVLPSAATPSASSFSNFLDNPSLGAAGNVLKANAGALLPAAELAYAATKGQQQPKGYNQLTDEANQFSAQGTALQSYLQNGTLPPGASAALQQAADSQKAAIRSQYAARGMSGSSAEQQDLAKVDQQVQTQGFEIASQLLQQGIQENQLASGIYQNLMNTQLSEDKELGSALTNFGVAAGGGSPVQTIRIGG